MACGHGGGCGCEGRRNDAKATFDEARALVAFAAANGAVSGSGSGFWALAHDCGVLQEGCNDKDEDFRDTVLLLAATRL